MIKTPVYYDDTQPFGYREFQLPLDDLRLHGDHYGIRDAEGKGLVGSSEIMVFRSDEAAREIAAVLNLFPLLARVLSYWMQVIESNEGRSDDMDAQVDLARSVMKTLVQMGALPHTRAPDETSEEVRCPTCGCPAKSIFDHLDGCPPEPKGGYPAATLIVRRKP